MRRKCLERGCIHDVLLRVGRRKTVLLIGSSYSAHFFKRRWLLLLHVPIHSAPNTLSQIWWSVPNLALKSPRRMSLSAWVLLKPQNPDHHRTCLLSYLGWSLCVHRHLQLLHGSCKIREVSASSGGHLYLLEVLRASHRSSFFSSTPEESVTSTNLFKGPSSARRVSELQSRLCTFQVLHELELFFAEVCQNQHCPLECAYSIRRWLKVSSLFSFFLFDREVDPRWSRLISQEFWSRQLFRAPFLTPSQC